MWHISYVPDMACLVKNSVTIALYAGIANTSISQMRKLGNRSLSNWPKVTQLERGGQDSKSGSESALLTIKNRQFCLWGTLPQKKTWKKLIEGQNKGPCSGKAFQRLNLTGEDVLPLVLGCSVKTWWKTVIRKGQIFDLVWLHQRYEMRMRPDITGWKK